MQLYYFQSSTGHQNFGDDLNPWLWERLLPEMFNDDDSETFVGIGTLLNDKIPEFNKYVVFSSGVGYASDIPTVDDNWKIYCVRGPKSAAALGLEPSYAITDGGALVHRVYTQKHAKKFAKSYMPHVTSNHQYWRRVCVDLGINYIDPTKGTEEILQQLVETEVLYTEAMHGAIIADALRTPWVPVVTTHKILDFKWHDWCESMELAYAPYQLPAIWDVASLNPLVHVKRWAKIRLAKSRFTAILDEAKPVLSRDDVLEERCQRLEERLEQFKQDVANGALWKR
ncbi:MAG: succinoglycan biosynthesis ketolase [Kangiellaceae bacterium]|nr:succinoglycan biosynthesis ketolase [Kangiellaceae bacterium]|tara:strand:+ start:4029 stop:4880 length:852 start_codon:yes stop_codon:yes gene_type:complete